MVNMSDFHCDLFPPHLRKHSAQRSPLFLQVQEHLFQPKKENVNTYMFNTVCRVHRSYELIPPHITDRPINAYQENTRNVSLFISLGFSGILLSITFQDSLGTCS
jgi:hypothetical protein